MQTDITSILRLNDWAGRVVLAFYGIGTAIVAVLNLSGHIFPWLGIAAIGLLWVGLGILARPDREPFSMMSTIAVIAIVAIVTAISCWNIANPASPGYSNWP